jgi:hypothetical protein
MDKLIWRENFYNKNVKPFLKYEKEAAKRIEKLFNVKIKKFNENNKYDFITTDNIKYEVKTDVLSKKTNNFFIEFSGYGKNSGITVSEANFYIITDTENYYLININILKNICNECEEIRQIKISSTYGYIIKTNIIIAQSQLI